MEEEKESYSLVEVPVQMGLAVKDNASNKVYDANSFLLKVANDLEEVKKKVLG